MEDKIKDLICRIEQLESEDAPIKSELGVLYGKMDELGFTWCHKTNKWEPKENECK